MEVSQLVDGVSWTTMLAILVGGYALAVALFVILGDQKANDARRAHEK